MSEYPCIVSEIKKMRLVSITWTTGQYMLSLITKKVKRGVYLSNQGGKKIFLKDWGVISEK